MDLAACDEIGQSQDGLITRRQALHVLSDNQINYLLKNRTWQPLYPALYRMTGVTDTWRRRVLGATRLRPHLAASHTTAAYLWGLIPDNPSDIHVLASMNRSARLPNVTTHRTRSWHPGITTELDGITITSPARTLIDLETEIEPEKFKTKRLLRIKDLADEFALIGEPRRKKCPIILEFLTNKDRRFERVESVGEVQVLDWIDEAGLPTPSPQVAIRTADGETFIADYAYVDVRIAIEVQSWQWHGGPAQYERDAHKSIQLTALGWIVVPVLPRESNKEHFVSGLSQLIESRSRLYA
jgi:hypothetical protein